MAGQTVVAQQTNFPPDLPPPPGSLKTVAVPKPANLSQYVAVADEKWAIVLGKALFWDQQAGSDGLACASCHFHAGADNRVKNQIDPDNRNVAGPPTSQTFHVTASNQAAQTMAPPGGGPNYTLNARDFPFHQLSDPLDANSGVLFDTPDVVSSQGVFRRDFVTLLKIRKVREVCKSAPSFFSVNGINVRQV